jgi:hypothetical protein
MGVNLNHVYRPFGRRPTQTDVPLKLDDSVDDYILSLGVYVQHSSRYRHFLDI